jgi:hypothetical protein
MRVEGARQQRTRIARTKGRVNDGTKVGAEPGVTQ